MKNIFDQAVKHKLMTCDNIRKIATVQGDDYTTGCLLDYNYFKNCYKMTVVDLSKQQRLNVNPSVMQQIIFRGNVAHETTIFVIIEEAKEAELHFSQRTVKVF